MTFYERYEMLCAERCMKAQTQEMQLVTGVTSGSISGWKKGSDPKIDVLCRLSKYFDVSVDYLLGLTELRKPSVLLSEHEQLLVNTYRMADAEGQMNIIYVCMDEKKKAEAKKETVSA